jgi:hypothetical protein
LGNITTLRQVLSWATRGNRRQVAKFKLRLTARFH